MSKRRTPEAVIMTLDFAGLRKQKIRKLPKNKLSDVPDGYTPGVFYIRVSTAEQGKMANGLEAQKESIIRFAEYHKIHQIGDFFEEIVSGGAQIDDRPVLKEAFQLAVDHGCPVIVSKLDRLSRDSAFVNNLIRDNYDFITVEHGINADIAQLQMYAIFAEKERKMIGIRTKEAMAQIKKRYQREYEEDCKRLGVENAVLKRFGTPNIAECETHVSKQFKRAGAIRRQRYMKDIFIPILKMFDYKPVLTDFVRLINDEGYKTDLDEPFKNTTVINVLRREFKITWTQFLEKEWVGDE